MHRLMIILVFGTLCVFAANRTPLVLDARIPTYPQLAVAARISGKVVVKLNVVGGIVDDTQVVHADNKLLIDSTIQNIRTWRFESSTNTQIETEFVYEIGKAESLVLENPVVELRLPESVHLIANPVKPTTNY